MTNRINELNLLMTDIVRVKQSQRNDEFDSDLYYLNGLDYALRQLKSVATQRVKQLHDIVSAVGTDTKEGKALDAVLDEYATNYMLGELGYNLTSKVYVVNKEDTDAKEELLPVVYDLEVKSFKNDIVLISEALSRTLIQKINEL